MASQVAHLVKNPPPMQETPVRFLGVEYPLEKGTATHASILAWKSPWTYSTWNVYTHSCIFYRFGQNVMSCLHHYSIIQSNFVCVCVCVCVRAHTHMRARTHMLHRVWLFETPWTVAHQAPLSIGFSRQEHWCGLPIPSPRDRLTQGTNLNPMSPALAGSFYFTSVKNPWAPSIRPLAPYLPAGNHCIFTVSIILPFLEFHLVKIIKYGWLLSLNDMH